MKNDILKVPNKFVLLSIVVVGFLLTITGLLYSSFALVTPIKSINFSSEKLNYNKKEPGSFQVEKSAEWIGSGKARITFQIDTILKTEDKNRDIIFVLDISGSMSGNKIERVKQDSIGLVDTLLSDSNNKAALITFDTDSEILSDFTNDKTTLISLINNLSEKGTTNYYQALINVDNILKNYISSNDRNCIVLFLTDGYPCEDTPNEESYFQYLKQEYPQVIVNGIQYEMGMDILDPIKKVSDNQYLADIETLNNILFDASIVPTSYDNFVLTDYIDTSNFKLESSNDITVSQGNVTFNQEEQKVTWTIDNLKSGSKLKMELDVELKSNYINQVGVYNTNNKEKVESSIGGIEENITSTETPRISNNYRVSYEGNAPEGCTVRNIPISENHFVFDKVSISEIVPECEGYRFQEWKVMGVEAKQINDDYFIMPEADVVLKAEWRKLSLAKSMSGEIYVAPVPKMQVALNSDTGAEEIWKYKDSVTKVVFQDQIKEVYNTLESFDLSEENNFGVMGRVVPNVEDSSTYTIYIQGDNRVIANKNSSYLFNQFRRLESVEGIEYFDTSNVTDMSSMFGWCESLKSLDLRTFDTSKVTTMLNMFRDNLALTSLDVSSFDTSNVTTMQWMFGGTSKLQEINLSSFNTSKVTDMTAMFAGTGLVNLDLSNFDTSNVTTMRVMFSNTNYLKSVNLSSFNTEKVTNTSNMFNNCYELENLDIRNFNTKNVTTMLGMFQECNKLEVLNINIDTFDTSLVTTMQNMFRGCSSLTSLDVSKFNTSKVTNMAYMFQSCKSLANLDVSKFNTSNVTNMGYMFQECNNITALDVSKFNTSKVTNMAYMFHACKSLTNLDVSKFNTSKVTNMAYMFCSCKNLPELNVSSFNTSNVTNMSYMFFELGKIQSLDLRYFNTSKVITMDSMFRACWYITTILQNFDTSSVTDMTRMFRDCQRLGNLNVTNFNTSKVTSMEEMFFNCTSLGDFDLSGFDTRNVTRMDKIFYNCWRLTTTFTIRTTNTTYSEAFFGTAKNSPAKLIINYTSNNSNLVDSMLTTKSSNSNVVKGSLVV